MVRDAANHAGMVLPPCSAASLPIGACGSDLMVPPHELRRHDGWGALVFFLLNVTPCRSRCAARTSRSAWSSSATPRVSRSQSRSRRSRGSWRRSTTPIAVVGHAALRAAAVHDPVAYNRFVEMREMFTQTIGALAGAVDKRDPFTSKHSLRVKEIAVDIGREMRVSEAELEALEWGGLLHDVGKIGVPDRGPPQAGAADPRGADGDERPSGAGRPDHRAGHRSWRPSCRSSATTTSGTTARATRTGSSATRSRSSPGSSTSPTRSRR